MFFSGTTRVSQALAQHGWEVWCNDRTVWSEVDVHQQVDWFIRLNDGSGTSVPKQVPRTSWSQTLTDGRMHPVGWVDGAEAVPPFGFPLISYLLISAIFIVSPYTYEL
jgi:hypothetical protein